MSRPDLYAGRIIDLCSGEDVQYNVLNMGEEGYTFVTCKVTHPRCCLDVNKIRDKYVELGGGDSTEIGKSWEEIIDSVLPPIGVSDTLLESDEWRKFVMGQVSPWIDPDSNDQFIRMLSEKALIDELQYFAYLGLEYISIRLHGSNHSNLARLLMQVCVKHNHSYAIWVELPICCDSSDGSTASVGSSTTDSGVSSMNGDSGDSDIRSGSSNSSELELNADEPWRWFYAFRTACGNDWRIGVCLELTQDLPEPLTVARWKGESIRAIRFNTRLFETDEDGLPVLLETHRLLAMDLFFKCHYAVVDGPNLHYRNEPEADSKLCVYYDYLNSLWKERPNRDRMSLWARGFEDRLQTPLQPLSQNLEAQVYESFEKDPMKYKQYQRAIKMAVDEKIENGLNSLVVMVLGAGRGPLVDACYEILKTTRLQFKLYAVEKNPFAVMTLVAKRVNNWNDQVDIVFKDMRNFDPEEKADIIVSELLGSFGDNELSPECLDGALHLMKESCVSIPSSYCSFIAPIHSPKIYTELLGSAQRRLKSEKNAFECPFVVRTVNYFEIAPAKGLFRFEHPNFKLTRNDRYRELTFTAVETSEMMGFSGFFYATLFDRVALSTVPGCGTNGHYSWFPMLFPLPNPVLVKRSEQICVRFWRCSDEEKVWYEWQLAKPVFSEIMNSNGRSYSMKLR